MMAPRKRTCLMTRATPARGSEGEGMKRPTETLWLRQARIAGYREAERQRRKGRARGPKSQRYVAPGAVIVAPKAFNITLGAGVEVVKFLRAVSTSVLVDQRPVILDFRGTEAFYPPATILLYSEVDRIVSMSSLAKPITIRDPRQRRAREVMKQIGIHDLTQDVCDIVPSREDVIYWRASKGATQSGESLQFLEAVADKVNKDQARHLELTGVWRGATEAVANAVEHAYKLPRDDGFQGLAGTRWWTFTQLRNGIFTMAVCDLGCGYRATIGLTLPEAFVSSVATAFKGKNRDACAIDTAMQYGRSGTKVEHRGKGSKDAMAVVEKHGEGELVVLSNSGWMRYVYSRQKKWTSNAGALGIDIRGTILWWKLPLGAMQ